MASIFIQLLVWIDSRAHTSRHRLPIKGLLYLFFRQVKRFIGNDTFRCQDHPCNTCGILNCVDGNFSRIDDTPFHQIAVFFRGCVPSPTKALFFTLFLNLIQYNLTLNSCILGNLLARGRDCSEQDLCAFLLIVVVKLLQDFVSAELLDVREARTSTGDNSKFTSTIYRIQSIFIPKFLVLEFCFCRSTNQYPSNTTTERRDTLCGLFDIKLVVGILCFLPDLCNAVNDCLLLLAIQDNRGFFACNNHTLGSPQHLRGDGIKRHT
mmetsp:Transcript_27847/g.64500  ORF Transcript_27847/g.64500 Transcript_27847/m.64500 type:complete len:265 (-) Transcript_27847:592-1386(-)